MNNQIGAPLRRTQVGEVATWRVWRALVGMGRLMRLSNSLPAAALVLIGARLVAGWPVAGRVWLAAAAMWAISAFGYVSNDLSDVAEDQVNKPDRPLVSGSVVPTVGGRLAATLAIGGLLLAATLGWREFVVALVVVGLLLFYSLRLKATAGGGNLLVAGLAGSTLLTGGVAAHGFSWAAVTPLIPAAALLAIFIIGRELVKTLEDVDGDRIAGKRTLAVVSGEKLVARVVGALAVVGLIVSVASVQWAGYSQWFLLLVLLGVQTPLFVTASYLWVQPTSRRATRSLRWLKASYFFGLVALLFAR